MFCELLHNEELKQQCFLPPKVMHLHTNTYYSSATTVNSSSMSYLYGANNNSKPGIPKNRTNDDYCIKI